MVIKIGIIGGTGLDSDIDILERPKRIELPTTPYGDASDKKALVGEINGVDIAIVSRHGKDHSVNPSKVNYRANMWSLKELGCDLVLATTACGSLRKHMKPEDFAILDQYIDR